MKEIEKMNGWSTTEIDYMKSYDVEDICRKFNLGAIRVILYGASFVARAVLYELNRLGIEVFAVIDSDVRKQGTEFCEYPVLVPTDIGIDQENDYVLVCSVYVGPMLDTLNKLGFRNVFSCVPLLKNVDVDAVQEKYCSIDLEKIGQPGQSRSTRNIQRQVELYMTEWMKYGDKDIEHLDLKYLDVVITETCSMKCKDCSNLMQYYSRPRHSDLEILFNSIDKIMQSVHSVYELRVLGGEPFMNKEISKVIWKLLSYDNAKSVVVYTNATIVPKDKNLECLKDERVLVDITDYKSHSRNMKKIREVFEREGVNHIVKTPIWTDSGRILPFQNRAEDELKNMFANCCNNDVLTILNGKLYRCPFSANATNLNAIPISQDELIDLEEEKSGRELSQKISELYYEKAYLTACSYCNGRDYTTPYIEPGIQTKHVLPMPIIK